MFLACDQIRFVHELLTNVRKWTARQETHASVLWALRRNSDQLQRDAKKLKLEMENALFVIRYVSQWFLDYNGMM